MAKADVFDNPRSLGPSRELHSTACTITRLQGTLLHIAHIALQDQDAFRPPHVN